MERSELKDAHACGLCLRVYYVLSIDECEATSTARCDVLWGDVSPQGHLHKLSKERTL